ncbi:MAG: tetratricopeptide repeat protein [Actinomycetes bacterium]
MTQSPMNLQGAIDLGAVVAARDAQAKAKQAAEERSNNPVASRLIVDVTTTTFEQDVLQQSQTVPVVVDLWATWCEPCKQLSPILESLVLEYDGKWILAKVDVDAEQQIAAAFQVQSIPAVFVVIGGQVAPMFQGAMPESQIRQVIDAVLLEAEKAGINGRVGDSQVTEADPVSLEVPGDPRYDKAESAIEAGDWESAIAAYKEILAETPSDVIARIGLLNVNLMKRSDGRDLAIDAKNQAQDTESRLNAADAMFMLGDFADSFAVLIDHVRSNSGKDKDAARERLLELFEIAGPADPAVAKGRSALTNALF